MTRGQKGWASGHNPTGVGPDHSQWKGGRLRDSRGYIRLAIPPDHPYAEMRLADEGRAWPRIFEHRLVMAEHLGRLLLPTEVVHHKLECEGGTGRKDDNRIENLRLFESQAEHIAWHRKHDN